MEELTLLQQRADRLHEVLNVAPLRPYKGGDSFTDISAYIDRIHPVLNEAIFAGFEGKHNDIALREQLREQAFNAYQSTPGKYLQKLMSGEVYEEYARAMLASRLADEVGSEYRNKTLNMRHSIKVALHSRAMAGVEDDFGSQHMFFNPYGVVLMNRDIKKAALCHEAAHIVLGHADRNYVPPDDRRKMELDATYVGALIHGDPLKYSELNRSVLSKVKLVGMEQHLDERRTLFYESRNKKPGEDAATDEQITKAIAEERFHFDYARRLTYPTQEEKVAVAEALHHELKSSMIKSWAVREKLREAIKERHVKSRTP